MRLRTIGWLSYIGLLTGLHVAYSTVSQQSVLDGVFFAQGSTVMSDGQTYPVVIRLQSDDNQLHDFKQINSDSQKFSFVMQSTLLGSTRLLTHSAESQSLLKNISVPDRDIAFNYAYLSSAASRLTLYKLNIKPSVPCFYIKELKHIWCLGVKNDISGNNDYDGQSI